MASLTDGPYRLRYVAAEVAEDTAGLYVTRVDGVGNPIVATQSSASLLDSENWWFAKTLDDKSWFILGSGPLPRFAGHGPVRLGFSHGVVKQGTPILFAAGLGEYTIEPLDNDEYTIAVAPNDDAETTTTNYIGKSSGGTLEIQGYPSQAGGKAVVPKWNFEKVQQT